MEKGHTKFSPDRHFGVMKQKFNNSDNIETHKDCVELIEKSSKKNLAVDLQKEKVELFEWDRYLKGLYKKCLSTKSIFKNHFYRVQQNDSLLYYRYKHNGVEFSEKIRLDVKITKGNNIPTQRLL